MEHLLSLLAQPAAVLAHLVAPPARPLVLGREQRQPEADRDPPRARRDEHHDAQRQQEEPSDDLDRFHDGTASTGTRVWRSTASAVDTSDNLAAGPTPR